MKCEYCHLLTGVECDGEASFILYRHKLSKPICAAISQHIWSQGRQPCYECRRPRHECWTTERIRVEATA